VSRFFSVDQEKVARGVGLYNLLGFCWQPCRLAGLLSDQEGEVVSVW
jgi:hypothetical protein